VANIADQPQQRWNWGIVNLLHFIGAVECSDRSGDERGNHLCITCQWLTPQQQQSGLPPSPRGRQQEHLSTARSESCPLPPLSVCLSLSDCIHPSLSNSPSLAGNLSSNQQSQKLPGNKTESTRMLACPIGVQTATRNGNKPIEQARNTLGKNLTS